MRARFATPDDVDAICRLCAEAYRDTYPELLEREHIEAIIGELYDSERVRGEIGPALPQWGGWVVADDDGTLVCAGGGGRTAPDVGVPRRALRAVGRGPPRALSHG